jgi:hypothetical protein
MLPSSCIFCFMLSGMRSSENFFMALIMMARRGVQESAGNNDAAPQHSGSELLVPAGS